MLPGFSGDPEANAARPVEAGAAVEAEAEADLPTRSAETDAAGEAKSRELSGAEVLVVASKGVSGHAMAMAAHSAGSGVSGHPIAMAAHSAEADVSAEAEAEARARANLGVEQETEEGGTARQMGSGVSSAAATAVAVSEGVTATLSDCVFRPALPQRGPAVPWADGRSETKESPFLFVLDGGTVELVSPVFEAAGQAFVAQVRLVCRSTVELIVVQKVELLRNPWTSVRRCPCVSPPPLSESLQGVAP